MNDPQLDSFYNTVPFGFGARACNRCHLSTSKQKWSFYVNINLLVQIEYVSPFKLKCHR